MKLLASLVGFAACALVGPLFAQEESASPTSEETPSTSVEAVQESPAPTPSPAIETKPSASPATTAAQTTPTKKMSPAAEAKTSPAVATTAAPAGKKMSSPAALKDSENRWAAALGKHDVATVEAIVATDFVGVNPKGKVQNRRGLINEMKGDKDNYTSNKNEKMDVHMFGPNLGVVVGTYREKGSGKDGKAFDRTYRYTDTWMERGGNWQCIASQVSLVAQK
jgi:ketosteroid isomerase-like protein